MDHAPDEPVVTGSGAPFTVLNAMTQFVIVPPQRWCTPPLIVWPLLFETTVHESRTTSL